MRVLPADPRDRLIVHTDGAARGNPGPAGIGAVITSEDGRTLGEVAEGIGVATNNVAEYRAAIEGLRRAAELGARSVVVRSDSRLLVEQLGGRFRVRNPTLVRLHEELRKLVRGFASVRFEHVPREQNRAADRLANRGVDEWLSGAGAGYRVPQPSPDLFDVSPGSAASAEDGGVSVLLGLLDRAHERGTRRLSGLTDDEFFWEPVAGCWTVHARRSDDQRWAPGVERFVNGRGEWVFDYAIPDPVPPPFTTIGWRLVHIASINEMYREHVFAAGKLEWDDFEIPHTAADAIRWWDASLTAFRGEVAQLTVDGLRRVVSVPWGVTESVQTWAITLIEENVHHLAEIGVLRDLHARGAGPILDPKEPAGRPRLGLDRVEESPDSTGQGAG